MSERVYVALGSNLGDRAALLGAARCALSLLPDTTLTAASRVEETTPLGGSTQGPFLNQMVILDTELMPFQLLVRLHAIEQRLGRVRAGHWASRTMDLDIVRFGDLSLMDPHLTLPHPGLGDREFWQREVAELDTLLERVA